MARVIKDFSLPWEVTGAIVGIIEGAENSVDDKTFLCEWAMKVWLLPVYTGREVKERKEMRVLELKEREGDEGERFLKTEPKESRRLRRTIMKKAP